ncbi:MULTISPECIES: stage II sporulation protein E [unclassified Clostridium]|uniref:stage II sporulation protein E n=1 Tax=unclassified Clostridium TaxID=2614128 RepID=UPI0032177F4A
MQYGENIRTYKRVKSSMVISNDRDGDGAKIVAKSIVFFCVAILVSRVIMINKSAPFGIAFLLTILFLEDNKLSLFVGLGSILGYITTIGVVENSLMYITIVPTLVIICLILNSFIKRNIKKFVIIGATLIMIFAYTMLVNQYTLLLALGNTALEGVSIIPVYLILEYSINSFKNIRTKHLFSNEEIVSMSILIALIIAGTWGIKVFNISILSVLSIAVVSIIGYVCGTSIGATAGIAMGVIVGMSSQNIFGYATVLGVCALTSGIFREGGKLISSLASFIVFCIMKIYIATYIPEGISQFILAEGILSTALFIVIPNCIYETISGELDVEKKSKRYEEGYANKVKGIFTDRLDKFSEVLLNMAGTLNNLADNDKLDMSTKSSGLIENLANRVCNSCDTCGICWGREMINTYKAFGELLESAQNKTNIFPQLLEKKCIRKASLIRNTEDIINKFIISEMWRSRLAEGRELIANQFNNMAKSVDEIMEEFSADFNEDKDSEKKIMRILEKYDIEADDVFAIKDKNERLNIQITCNSCNGRNLCIKKILPLINDCVDYKMKLKADGCKINPITNKCTAMFEEVPKFGVTTSVSRACKDGQTIFGDNFNFGEGYDGSYMMVISDGMGSGPQAGRESKAVVELIEKFTSAGFSRTTAINTVNSIMSLKFSEDEKFSTVDLSAIDLYSGEVDFMKVGAVASIVKSGDTIDIIKSRSLPIGILDEADIEIHSKKVKNGDLIVMLTDGVTDCDEESSGKIDWILDYLCRNDNVSPEELSKGIINEAKRIGKNKVKDDMTVMVSRVHTA